jgi:lambda repressor-like predicted transcriptional regulator
METNIAFDERAFRIALARAGFRSVAQLGRKAGLSESYARQIAHGLVPSPKVQAKLATFLGVQVNDLWHTIATAEQTGGGHHA